jgi:putative ABC transport system substrate-binding protein
MRRRDFIAGLGLTSAAWPLVARAQQMAMKHIGALMDIAETDAPAKKWVGAFETQLAASGWRKGRDCDITYRWGASNPELLARHAEELVRLAPDVVMVHGTPAMISLQKMRTAIPIVFTAVSDPIGQGFVVFPSRWKYNRLFQLRARHRQQMAASLEGYRSLGDECRGDVQSAHLALQRNAYHAFD